MEARLIYHGDDVYWNMALDEALLDYAIKRKEAIIRLYTWRSPSVTFGFFQKIRDVINEKKAMKKGIEFTRRITGGGAVLHNIEYTYTIIMPTSLGIEESYRYICGCIVNALKSNGINAEFHPINDITVKGLKVSGSAQTRRENWLLQHGTLLLNVDIKLMKEVLKIPEEKKKKYGKKLVVGLEEIKDIDKKKLKEAIISSFCEGLDLEIKEEGIPKGMEEKIEKLRKKYKDRRWIYMR